MLTLHVLRHVMLLASLHYVRAPSLDTTSKVTSYTKQTSLCDRIRIRLAHPQFDPRRKILRLTCAYSELLKRQRYYQRALLSFMSDDYSKCENYQQQSRNNVLEDRDPRSHLSCSAECKRFFKIHFDLNFSPWQSHFAMPIAYGQASNLNNTFCKRKDIVMTDLCIWCDCSLNLERTSCSAIQFCWDSISLSALLQLILFQPDLSVL